MLIVRPQQRRDWFTIPGQWQPEVGTIPIIEYLKDGRLSVHRSHLAVLAQNHPEARQALDQLAVQSDRAALDAQTEALGWKLRSYQHVGREFIIGRRGTLLSDQMRVGKTLTTVAAHDPDSGPLIIVGPLAARAVWIKEIKRRWPDQETLVLSGRKLDRRKLGDQKYDPALLNSIKSAFVHYDILQSWQTFGTRLNIGTLVFDEAHTLSNHKSRRSQAALLLSSRAERVVAVTGTPLWNKPEGIWTILACIVPGAFGKYHDFSYRYAGPMMTPYGVAYVGSSNEEEFKLRLTEVMIRREWKDIKKDLPPVERTVEVADVTEKQSYELEMAVERAKKADDKPTCVGELARLRRLLGEIKLAPAIDAAVRVLESEEPVVVWAWHRDIAARLADGIAKAGHTAYCISGATSTTDREGKIELWKNGPVAALVCTIPVGQVAIDLSHSRHAIYAEVDWTPATVAQSEMRVFSPDRPMSVTYIVADHEVDRCLVNALQAKCITATNIGVPAADTTVETIANAFNVHSSGGSIDRLMAAILGGAAMEDDDNRTWHPDNEFADE